MKVEVNMSQPGTPPAFQTASSYFGTFVWAVIVGMGLHIGWGLISLIVWVAAKSLNQPGMIGP